MLYLPEARPSIWTQVTMPSPLLVIPTATLSPPVSTASRRVFTGNQGPPVIARALARVRWLEFMAWSGWVHATTAAPSAFMDSSASPVAPLKISAGGDQVFPSADELHQMPLLS